MLSCVAIRLQLLDAETGSSVWAASARTGGNAFAGTGTLLRSMASRAVKQLPVHQKVPLAVGSRDDVELYERFCATGGP